MHMYIITTVVDFMELVRDYNYNVVNRPSGEYWNYFMNATSYDAGSVNYVSSEIILLWVIVMK